MWHPDHSGAVVVLSNTARSADRVGLELTQEPQAMLIMTTQSLAAVRAHVSQVIDEVSGTHERVTITENGSPVAVLLAIEDYESLMETPEILSEPRARSDVRQAETEMAGGQIHDEAQVRAALAARRG